MAEVLVRLIPGYSLCAGSTLDRALLVKFMHQTYRELYPGEPLSHLAETVEQYLSKETPLWWVKAQDVEEASPPSTARQPLACLWLGNAIDQIQGDRHAHIFLLYVTPEYRYQGIGSALVRHAEDWARGRGDRQIGLQVFQDNQPAMNLYQKLGYKPQSLWMVKPLF